MNVITVIYLFDYTLVAGSISMELLHIFWWQNGAMHPFKCLNCVVLQFTRIFKIY